MRPASRRYNAAAASSSTSVGGASGSSELLRPREKETRLTTLSKCSGSDSGDLSFPDGEPLSATTFLQSVASMFWPRETLTFTVKYCNT
eukprot:2103804-Prymnesium_polylepis.1